jgi:hypothetical protein
MKKCRRMLVMITLDMHALLLYVKLGRDPGYRRQFESAFI